MSFLAGLVRWCDRWFNNGANLITLSRIPVLFFILGTIYSSKYQLPSWYPLLLGSSLIGVFWQGGISQTIGMIADGLDGWFARRWSKVGPTPEGQFLDQFVDKIFVWVVWWALSACFYTDSWYAVLYWWLPSSYMFFLDCRSCYKHWLNYRKDKGKKVNLKHGAVMKGKIKFAVQNIVVCLNYAALCPPPTEGFPSWHDWATGLVYYGGFWLQSISFLFIFVAIWLARGSLRQRGVLPPKKDDDDHRFDRYAEASL